MSQPYKLYFKLIQVPSLGMLVSGQTESLMVEHTVVDGDPVAVIERAMQTLENTRDELLAQREPTIRYELSTGQQEEMERQGTIGYPDPSDLTQEEEDALIKKYSGNRSHQPCADVRAKIPHDPHTHPNAPGQQIKSCPGYVAPEPHKLIKAGEVKDGRYPTRPIRDNPQG